MSWIQTYSGKAFDLWDPQPDQIDITDIAHALSLQCRFNGHCRQFYSVAQHSVLVARLLPEPLRLYGLLHDAAEAYIGDIVRPLKERLVMFGMRYDGSNEYTAFKYSEANLIERIYAHFRLRTPLEYDERQAIKYADDVMLATEARDLLAPPPRPWGKLPEPDAVHIAPLDPSDAKGVFLATFEKLTTSLRSSC